MVEVTALTSFEHHGTRIRGANFEVSQQHASLLSARGLVKISAVAESAASASAASPVVSGAALVRQKPEKAIAALAAVTDRATLEDARSAEIAKGAKAREAVLGAIDAALAALPASQE
ncbi:hypothetical protein [Stenotrophomonas indicatrix]|uniref:hypothetical protein n=1 Tax=Stenotrophomonas indicatrix TaxID=2045451 RepID=UPI001CC1B1C4|nr:hypothetical protein [Stenotrophomonas indicatrix]